MRGVLFGLGVSTAAVPGADPALALTGRLADGWIPSLGFAPPEQVTAMRERMLAAAARAGRRPEEITCAYNLQVRVGQHGEPRPSLVSGSPDAVTKRLLSFAEMGFTALNLMPAGPGEDEQVERLAREVVPAVCARLGQEPDPPR
jgi:alkanesulfonate monooxygenase SsuD/methylene tetrahydromethanopterin reductase-like flavin-dependent oxidoreductase (luciferase family)